MASIYGHACGPRRLEETLNRSMAVRDHSDRGPGEKSRQLAASPPREQVVRRWRGRKFSHSQLFWLPTFGCKQRSKQAKLDKVGLKEGSESFLHLNRAVCPQNVGPFRLDRPQGIFQRVRSRLGQLRFRGAEKALKGPSERPEGHRDRFECQFTAVGSTDVPPQDSWIPTHQHAQPILCKQQESR